MKNLRLLEKLWLLGPMVIWFSYQPLLKIGQDSTSYYELSIPLIWLVIVALVGLPNIWRGRHTLLQLTSVRLVGMFVVLSLVSLLWTSNLMRGILTAGIIGALCAVLVAGLAEQKRLRKLAPLITRIFIISAVVISILALVQVAAGIWLDRETTLLCAGCVAEQFGFVRPNVFTIEPQFLGSLFLAPLLILTWQLLTRKWSKDVVVAFLIVSVGLFLTLSRGAIFAFGLGAIVLFVIHNKKIAEIIRVTALLTAGFIMTLTFQGTAAALSPRVNETFMGAVSASVSQLSLGIIDIPVDDTSKASKSVEISTPTPRHDGYIEESTDIRLNRSQLALNTWADNALRMMFGVGLGGSGVAVHEKYPAQTGPREIVQNEYIEVLIEYGLIGLGLFAAIIIGLFYSTRRYVWVWAIILAYLAQWVFFSGYPNALHIYLLFILLAVVFTTAPRDQSQPAKRY